MIREMTLRAVRSAAIAVCLVAAVCAAVAGTYTEDFSSTVHRDLINTTAWWDTAAGELRLYPVNPVLKGTCQTGNWPCGIAVSGDYAYVCDGDFRVVNIGEPTHPVTVASCTTECYTGDVDLAGHYAYVTDYSGGQACTAILVIDIADPLHPSVVGRRNIAWGCMLSGISVSGNYAYVAGYDYDFMIGLLVFDISDPRNPQFVGSVSAGSEYLYDVDVSGNYAYVTDWYYGLKVMDLSDPAQPELVDSCFASQAAGIEVSEGYAYVARGARGFQVVDLSDPAHPVPAGWTAVPGYPYRVAVSGGSAYLANYNTGLQVIDIADPEEPVLVGTCNTPGQERAVAVSGNHAYISADTAKFHVIELPPCIYDLARNAGHSLDLEPGMVVGQVRLTSVQADSIRWEITADSGLHWQDVRPGADWELLAYPGSSLMWRSAHYYTQHLVNPSCTYLEIEYEGENAGAGGTSGGSTTLLACAPNPFRFETRIRFALPAGGVVQATVHDVTGRMVAGLADGYCDGGEQSVVWNGCDNAGQPVSPGIYFVRVNAGRHTSLQKMVLLQ